MELFISLLVAAALCGLSTFTIKRRYAHQLLSEQNKASSLAISESQLKQKNMMLTEELDRATKEAEQLQQQCATLSEKLATYVSQEEQVRRTAESLSRQLSHESNQRLSFQEQLHKTQELAGAASSQLYATIEEQSAKLQQLQQLLHNEQVTRKKTEEIFALKETEYKQNIAALNSTALSLKNQLQAVTEGFNNESSARENIERVKTHLEQELLKQKSQLEAELAALKAEHEKIEEAFREENRVRLATEHALQESKEKLYAVIHNLEAKLQEHEREIATLNRRVSDDAATISSLQHAVDIILNNVPVQVFVVNNEGICLSANASLYATLGYSSNDIVGKHFSILFPKSDSLFYEEQWRTTENRAEQFKGETRFAAITGDIVLAELTVAEIFNGHAKNYIGFIVDKTTEREAAKYYQKVKEREEELAELKSRFIAMVTHQLRAALVTVASNTELLERFMFKWSDEKRYRAFFRMNETIKQMLNLLRNVEFSTSAVTQYKPEARIINLETLAQSVAKEAANELETKHRFILSEQGEISAVALDETVVRTVLLHTLSNAFKFSPEEKEVKLHIERNDGVCVFIIQDYGIGIPQKEQQRLFQSFFRGSNVGNIHGTGLGLTIVQQYVQLAGGTVSIESQEHKGTTVKITLPIHQ